jgi:two-component system, NarL family, response regulator NreC
MSADSSMIRSATLNSTVAVGQAQPGSTDATPSEPVVEQEFFFIIGPTGERTVLTPSYYQVTGYTPEEIRTTDFRTRIHPDDLAMVERTCDENLRGISTQIVYRSLRKDGSVLWLESGAQPILDAQGTLERIICRSRTISDPNRTRKPPPNRESSGIRVLIVDDHAVLRTGLRMLLTAQPDMTVVGEAAEGAKAVELARTIKPDVVTLDLNMPGIGGLTILEMLKTECPAARILVLTMHDDAAYLKAVLAAGGAGYVTKTADESELLGAIRAVSQGRTSFNLSMNDALMRALLGVETRVSSGAVTEELSEREREVLELVAQGHTSQKVADRLFLSVKTIETYRARLMKKLGLQDRAQLVQFALQAGLLGGPHSGDRPTAG